MIYSQLMEMMKDPKALQMLMQMMQRQQNPIGAVPNNVRKYSGGIGADLPVQMQNLQQGKGGIAAYGTPPSYML